MASGDLPQGQPGHLAASAWIRSHQVLAVGKTTLYRWKSGKWVKTSNKKVHYKSDKAAFVVGGWHLRGLPVWPK